MDRRMRVPLEWNLRFGDRERDILAVALARLKRDLESGEHLHEIGGRALRHAVLADVDQLRGCLTEEAAVARGKEGKPTGMSTITRYWVGPITRPTGPPVASFAQLDDAVSFAVEQWTRFGWRQMWLVVDVTACEPAAVAEGRITYDCDTAAVVFHKRDGDDQETLNQLEAESYLVCPFPGVVAGRPVEGARTFVDLGCAVEYAGEQFVLTDQTWIVVDQAAQPAPRFERGWDPEDATVAFFLTSVA
jgi:hypothetical protein